MQGRLSPMIDQKIQAFPEDFWMAEFFSTSALNFDLIEWTLDYKNLLCNPFLTNQNLILKLQDMTGILVKSVTYDAAMQAPFSKWDLTRKRLFVLKKALSACLNLKVNCLVLPLVDNSTVTYNNQEGYVDLLRALAADHLNDNLKIAIEFLDFPPFELKQFIEDIGSEHVGVNYDTGNSASLGYDFEDEMNAYCKYILNIHVKDRKKGGDTYH